MTPGPRRRRQGAGRGRGRPLVSALRRRAPAAALLTLALGLCLPAGLAATELAIVPDGAGLTSGPLHVKVTVSHLGAAETVAVRLLADGVPLDERDLAEGEHSILLPEARLAAGSHALLATGGGASAETQVWVVPGWLSVVPPLIAIALALIFKDVILSLFAGIYFGALALAAWNPATAFARAIDHFILPSLADGDHASIIVFSTLLGGMVGVISKSGGSQGIVDRLRPYATSARRGQVAAWMMGVLIFFDDYANTLIVGPTMRPITDRLRISREKLAYIVDSTAAPVASVIPISTWIGFEVGLIAAAFTQLGIPYNAYTTFIASILYRFYPIFALVLGFAIAFSCRDFGPMLRAELRASESGQVIAAGAIPLADFGHTALSPPEGAPLRARNALLPILTVVLVTVGGLFGSGSAKIQRADYPSTFSWVQDAFSNADSFKALLWASLAGVTVALALATAQRILPVRESMGALLEGFKSMMLALVVLVLAWSIGQVCGELHTADYVVGLTQGTLAPHWLPVLTFVVSAAVSFATGTSWGTMAILMPLVIPISHGLSLAAGHAVTTDTYYVFMLGTISSVLAGSVWGDHCSPISDTTILSSMASGCDHIAHVRTQMPYALGIGILGMLVGDIPTAFGLSPWVSIFGGSAIIIVAVRFLGTRSDWRGAGPGAA